MTRFTIIGGGGQVALCFTKAASPAHSVANVVRDSSHDGEIKAAGGVPVQFSLESSTVDSLAEKLRELRTEAVLFSAGAAGKGGKDRTRAVDFEGAVKTFKAMERAGVRRILLISAADVRDRSQPAPSHYNEADLQMSEKTWSSIGDYMQAKLDADNYLMTSTSSLEWTVLRPGALTLDASVGKIQLGHPHLGKVSREDVGLTALSLLCSPRSSGRVFDLMGPSEESGGMGIDEAVQRAVASA